MASIIYHARFRAVTIRKMENAIYSKKTRFTSSLACAHAGVNAAQSCTPHETSLRVLGSDVVRYVIIRKLWSLFSAYAVNTGHNIAVMASETFHPFLFVNVQEHSIAY
jgi:hypothetical protein